MIQEDKLLLLKDLSARLPYGVKVKTPYNDAILIGLIKRKGFKKDEYYIDAITDKQTYPVRYIQPYLRPISSMTEEEIVELKWLNEKCDAMPTFEYVPVENYRIYDWMNRHHFDYRGLIEKNLAIEVTDENNQYKD